ncbi:ATP-dependent DNA helicase RecG [Candidatus Kaiserbacteria bacterium]|nr:ATP-dependent DNA helicase RecG [Candidatus Kaiserbacteria bacterium]
MELSDHIEIHFRLLETQKRALRRLNLLTIEDILYHFPTRYENISDWKHVAELKKDDSAILYGTLSGLKTRKSFRSRVPISEARFTDETGSIKIIWFHQPYIAKMFRNGASVKLAGKVGGDAKSLFIANPEIEKTDSTPLDVSSSLFGNTHTSLLYPLYPESKGVTSKWFYHALKKIFESGILETIEDPVPDTILARYNLPKLTTALVWVHAPRNENDSASARKRFAFNEVFYIQLLKQRERRENDEKQSLTVTVDEKKIAEFIERFPFEATDAQKKAIKDILSDFKKEHPMARLLEGDVGSGKTAVAATTVYAAATSRPPRQDFGNLQIAYMVPTEILAQQHFESFIAYFKHLPIQIALITSSGCKKFPSKVNKGGATDISRTQLLKWVKNGEIPILIGTHALIQKTVEFKNLAYVIIDEQHRFGTFQRQKLVRKPARSERDSARSGGDNVVPHLLSMTATPIPRTLALTVYGDLDLTLLDEMPKGRKQIMTEIVLPDKRERTYEKIREELRTGRQAYVICPRIDEPDPTKALALQAKSVNAEARRLKKDIFPECNIGILHSKLKPTDKESVMKRFVEGDVDILVATSVVEVGVNVPNATIIVIEGAERFGLAQLHQLRGRVIRSNHQAYCFVFTDSKSKGSQDRLKALGQAKNGFELAEFDLKFRGAGELYGKKQWGLSDVGMEAIKNVKMVEAARNEAQKMVEGDPTLAKRSSLKKIVETKKDALHFE